MEYVQERVATLHDFTDPVPDAPVERAAVVVPMTEREHASLAAERVLSALEAVREREQEPRHVRARVALRVGVVDDDVLGVAGDAEPEPDVPPLAGGPVESFLPEP